MLKFWLFFRREKPIAKHNLARNILAPFFSFGDFFIVRRAVDGGQNPRLERFGPCHITAVHRSLFYGITSLNGQNNERVHCDHLLRYDDSRLSLSISYDILDLGEGTESR